MYNNYDKWPWKKKIIYVMYPPTFAISAPPKKKKKKMEEEIVDSPFSVQETRKGKDSICLYLAAIQSAKKAYQLSQHLHSKRIVVRDLVILFWIISKYICMNLVAVLSSKF